MSGITRPRFRWEDSFTMVPNAWARDSRLGRRARGLLLELMSHEPGWVTSVQQLIDGGQEGKDAIRADLNALVEAGYLRRISPERARGRFAGVSWEVCDPFDGGSTANPDPEQGPHRGGSTATVNPPPKKNTLKKNPLPPAGEDPPPASKPRRAPSAPIPDAWAPTPEHGALAAELGHVNVESQAALFRDWAAAKDARYVRWDAAFSNWLRKAAAWAAERAPKERPVDAPDPNAWMTLGPKVDPYAFAPEGWTPDE